MTYYGIRHKIEIGTSIYNYGRTANMNTKNVIPISETKEESNVVSPIDFAGNKQLIDDVDIPNDVVPFCYIVCGYFILALVTIGWIVASSIALSQSSISEFREDCSGSNLWVSLLVLVIAVGLGMVDSWCGKRDENNKRQPNVLIMAAGLGSQIFSSIEVFNSCALATLNHTLVYELQFWMLIVTFSLYGIMIVGGCVMCCICCREEAAYKTPSQTDEEIANTFANLQATIDNLKKGETVIGDNNV